MKKHRHLYTKTIKNLDELIEFISRPPLPTLPTVYRGQPNSEWLVQSSFSRWYNKNFPDSDEAKFIEDFDKITKMATENQKSLHHYHHTAEQFIDNFAQELGDIEGLDKNYSQMLFLAQHYGIPTNLLDFTYNPFIALYFAFDYKEEPDSGFVSWFKTTPLFVAQRIIKNIAEHHFIEKEDELELWNAMTSITKAERGLKVPNIKSEDVALNIRIQAQQGCFVYFPESYPYDKVMHMLEVWKPNGGWGSQAKVDIPISLKGEIIEMLNSKGISKDTVYPIINHSGLPAEAILFDEHLKSCANKVMGIGPS